MWLGTIMNYCFNFVPFPRELNNFIMVKKKKKKKKKDLHGNLGFVLNLLS